MAEDSAPSTDHAPPQPDASRVNAVEMDNLTPPPAAQSNAGDVHHDAPPEPSTVPPASQAPLAEPSKDDPEPAPTSQNASADDSSPSNSEPSAAGPAVKVTLLLVRNNARHDFEINEKYLKRRNVNQEPWDISVYTMKELIWRDWRQDWEDKPSTAAAIRLISFGRELDDKDALKACRFNTQFSNVVHMTIRPQEVSEEEDGKMGKSTHRGDADAETTAGCCRCIIL